MQRVQDRASRHAVPGQPALEQQGARAIRHPHPGKEDVGCGQTAHDAGLETVDLEAAPLRAARPAGGGLDVDDEPARRWVDGLRVGESRRDVGRRRLIGVHDRRGSPAAPQGAVRRALFPLHGRDVRCAVHEPGCRHRQADSSRRDVPPRGRHGRRHAKDAMPTAITSARARPSRRSPRSARARRLGGRSRRHRRRGLHSRLRSQPSRWPLRRPPPRTTRNPPPC